VEGQLPVTFYVVVEGLVRFVQIFQALHAVASVQLLEEIGGEGRTNVASRVSNAHVSARAKHIHSVCHSCPLPLLEFGTDRGFRSRFYLVLGSTIAADCEHQPLKLEVPR
jgi:hypothetical protein